MKFSKLFPMATDEADNFIQHITIKGKLERMEPLENPYAEAQLLYLGSHGFITITKKPKEGKCEVIIET